MQNVLQKKAQAEEGPSSVELKWWIADTSRKTTRMHVGWNDDGHHVAFTYVQPCEQERKNSV